MDFHMLLFHLLSLKLRTHKINSFPFLENIPKFHLDLCSPRYNNSSQVSYLGMNLGRGWNPNLEGSYLPEYSESEAEFWIQCISRCYLRPMQFLAPEPFPIQRYREFTKMYKFQYLGFFQLGVKLGFEFLEFHPTKNLELGL